MLEDASVVLLAGGLGTRFEAECPKQLVAIAGRPLLSYTLALVARVVPADQIVVAANPQWREPIERVIGELPDCAAVAVVDGGPSRNESAWRALTASRRTLRDKVLVHDGVRPLASPALFARVARGLDDADAVAPVAESVDPLFQVSQGRVEAVLRRDRVLRGQSPQGFHRQQLHDALGAAGEAGRGRHDTLYGLLLDAHPAARVVCVAGEHENIKVTQPVDRRFAKVILRKRRP